MGKFNFFIIIYIMNNLDVGYKVLPDIKSAGLKNSADFGSKAVGGRKKRTKTKSAIN